MYIKSFEEISRDEVETVGGKGANLGEMVRAGINVPAGGVLTVQAYERFMEWNHLRAEEEPGKLRAAILAGEMPEDVQREIAAFYKSLGENVRVAVRSSATAEDLEDASFAGQQETYLNVQGEKLLLDRVRACYASLWGKRAVSYRREKEYDSLPVALAVVIQLMVESEVAGVLFTENPANGAKDEMLINASYGLGESVVSGAVSPDELICHHDGQIIRQVTGSKETMVVYGKEETVTIPVKPEDQSRLCLTEAQTKQLAGAGRMIQAHYGMPMDVEWAFAKGTLFILQARAVTAKGEPAFDAGIMPAIKPLNKKMRTSLLFMLEKQPIAYTPLDYDFSMLLGRQKANIFEEGGLLLDNDCSMDENGFMHLPTDKFRVGKNLIHLPKLLHQMRDHPENVRKAKEALEQAEKELLPLAETKFETVGIKDCLRILAALYELIIKTAYARFKYAVFPGFMMNKKLQKYLKKAGADLTAYDLLSGLSYKTADMNYELTALADRVKADQAARKAVLSGKTYEEITAEVPEAGARFAEFLKRNGYKSDFNCYCFAAKTWIEDKERFLQVLRPLLTAEREKQLSLAEGQAFYKELLQEMTADMGAKQRKEVLHLVENYRFYHVYREKTQYLWETTFYICRKALQQAAELLLVRAEDLQYLFWEELQPVLKRGRLTKEEYAIIEKRKELRPAAEEFWKRQQWEALKGEGEVLTGVSGSAGEASGTVCVITSPAEFWKLKKGEILVCRYTDPEWTPLFTLAAAVISDTGGTLSHAAIVAREYHIPAVLAVGCATVSLKDGDKVFVNGTLGEVRRL